ncbi:MAG: MlaD family protein [Pirellulales bacterium]|nr:MlaD family protein [Pirellulales bacterium]
MDERLMQFRVGVMAVATVLIAGILIVLFGKVPAFTQGSYTLQFKFAEAPGVSVNSPVRKSGILVGRVSQVDFADDGEVIVTVTMNGDIKIRRSETVRIKSTLLGDAEIQIVAAKKDQAGEFYQPGETIVGQTASDPLNALTNLEESVKGTVKSLGNASDEIGKLAASINERFERNKERFDSIVINADKTLQGINRTLDGIKDVLGGDELKNDLRKAIQEVPELLRTTKDAIQGLQSATAGVERNVRNLEGLTKPLGDRGEQIVANVDQSVARLNELVGQVETFSRRLNSDQGTVGRLLNDPALYQQLNEAAANINDVSKRLRPIVEDARILTDRLARNPGIIIRDAVQPGPGTKFLTPQDR